MRALPLGAGRRSGLHAPENTDFTEDPQPHRDLWSAVILKAKRDADFLDRYESTVRPHRLSQRQRHNRIALHTDPRRFLASEYCRGICQALGVTTWLT